MNTPDPTPDRTDDTQPNPLLGETGNPLLGDAPTPADSPARDQGDAKVVARLPEEIIALVLSIGTDPDYDTNDPEIAAVLPSPEVIAAVLAANGHRPASPVQDIDQALAWMDEQALWQTRATKVEAELQRRFPFQKDQALKGEIPAWMTEPWAVRLIYKWSDDLADAVESAEQFLKKQSDGVSNG